MENKCKTKTERVTISSVICDDECMLRWSTLDSSSGIVNDPDLWPPCRKRRTNRDQLHIVSLIALFHFHHTPCPLFSLFLSVCLLSFLLFFLSRSPPVSGMCRSEAAERRNVAVTSPCTTLTQGGSSCLTLLLAEAQTPSLHSSIVFFFHAAMEHEDACWWAGLRTERESIPAVVTKQGGKSFPRGCRDDSLEGCTVSTCSSLY